MNAIQVKVPEKAIVYTRLSASDDELSLGDQDAQSRVLAEKLGWGVLRTETEAKTSAWKRKRIKAPDGRVTYVVVRPVWSRIMDSLESGEADSLIVVDRDRACRQPIDLERLIDVHLATGVPVESVSGSLRLSGADADITMARVMVAVSWQESADKARRVKSARKRQADAGTFGGGTRPYGWVPVEGRPGKLALCPDEAEVVRFAAKALIEGRSQHSIAKDLNKTNKPSVKGGPWSADMVRNILSRDRNGGTLGGQPGQWEAILDTDVHEQVLTILSSPARRTSPGNKGRWLGSGVYRCGTCGSPLYARHENYDCRAGHVRIRIFGTDKEVTARIVLRLAQPDAAALLAPSQDNGTDIASLAHEAAQLRTRKAMLAGMFAAGEMDAAEWKAASTVIKDKLSALDAKLTAAADRGGDAPAAAIAGRADAEALWDGMDLETQRKVLRSLVTVVVAPQGKGVRRPGWKPGESYAWFNSARVSIAWNGEQEAAAVAA